MEALGKTAIVSRSPLSELAEVQFVTSGGLRAIHAGERQVLALIGKDAAQV